MPWMTNAMLNQKAAVRLFKAGYTPGEIAKLLPEVFKCVLEDGEEKLSLRYSAKETRILQAGDPIAKKFGVKEQDRMIQKEYVDELVKKKGRKKGKGKKKNKGKKKRKK